MRRNKNDFCHYALLHFSLNHQFHIIKFIQYFFTSYLQIIIKSVDMVWQFWFAFLPLFLPPHSYVAPGRLLSGAPLLTTFTGFLPVEVGVVQCLVKPSSGNMRVVSNPFTNDAIQMLSFLYYYTTSRFLLQLYVHCIGILTVKRFSKDRDWTKIDHCDLKLKK